MGTKGSAVDLPTHYEILDLPKALGAGSDLPTQQLKAAYRRALLQHHPDKNQAQVESPYSRSDATLKAVTQPYYTIDQISEAYTVLSAPKLRSEYDQALKTRAVSTAHVGHPDNEVFYTGSESVDLDDLTSDAEGKLWYRSCRCGDERGFLVQEADLEKASDIGELHVGCRGCSLWLRVLFGVVEESSDSHH